MDATLKQRRFLANLIRNHDSVTAKTIYESIPKNNKEYPDVNINCKDCILADKLIPLNSHQASLLINVLGNKKNEYNRGYNRKLAYSYLLNLKLI